MEEKLDKLVAGMNEMQEKLNEVLYPSSNQELLDNMRDTNGDVEYTLEELDEIQDKLETLLKEEEEDEAEGITILVVASIAFAIVLPLVMFFVH